MGIWGEERFFPSPIDVFISRESSRRVGSDSKMKSQIFSIAELTSRYELEIPPRRQEGEEHHATIPQPQIDRVFSMRSVVLALLSDSKGTLGEGKEQFHLSLS